MIGRRAGSGLVALLCLVWRLAAPGPAPAAARVDSALVDSARQAAALRAPSPEPSPAESLVAPPAPAPVFLGGRVVFRVRSPRDGLEPVARAAAIRGRLDAAVKDLSLAPDSVRLVRAARGVEVRLGPRFLMLVTPEDVEARDPAGIANELGGLATDLRAGIARERAGRTPARVAVSILIALGLTLVLGLVLKLLVTLGRRVRMRIRRTMQPRLPSIRVRNLELFSPTEGARSLACAFGILQFAVGVVIAYIYLAVVLARFPWTQGWSWQLRQFAAERAASMFQSMIFALPGLIVVAIILLGFRWIVHLSDRVFDSVARADEASGGLHPELARPTRRLVRIALWIIAAAVAYPYIPGSHSRAFQGVSLLVGVMLSFGSSGFVGNIIAGLVLTYSRSFRAGERVRLGEHVGDVVSLGFFATKLRSLRNEEITIPNAQIASASILNFTRLAEERGLILHSEVTIGYDADWRTVHALLIAAAQRVRGVESSPVPWVNQRALGDNNVTYEINCVTRDSHDQLRLYSDLHAEIQDAFSRAGLEILSPAYHAIRDANAPVLPREPAGPRAEPGGFRVRRPD